MHSKINKSSLKAIIWWFSKTMRHAMQGLYVDSDSVKMVKGLLSSGKKVVLMPIYKSFADVFINMFLHHHFEIEAPFMFGNKEDMVVNGFSKWLKDAGYINSRRSYKQSVQSRYINSAMLKEIIENN